MPNSNFVAAGASSFNDVSQEHSYETDLGVVVMPVAGRTSKHRLIRLHGGYATRKVKWRTARTGKPPIIPSAVHLSNDTLIGYTVTPHLPTPIPNENGLSWVVEGEYLYVQSTPRVPGTHTLPTGSLPFTNGAMDILAGQIANKKLSSYTAPSVGSINAADSLFTALSDDPTIVDHLGDAYIWPFTALPRGFTNDYLISH